MKRNFILVILTGILCFSAHAQTEYTGKLVEFRVRQFNYTREMNQDVKVTVHEQNGVKYLDIVLTPLANSSSWRNVPELFYNLYNDSTNIVSWKNMPSNVNYVPVADYVFVENINGGKRLYLIEDGVNQGNYNTNIIVVLLPDSFSL
jgi:hypothetical protein